jgi:hypothetical protein
MDMLDETHGYLRQRVDQHSTLDSARNDLVELAHRAKQKLDAPQQQAG